MTKRPIPTWFRVLLLIAELLLAAAAVAFPLVISDAVLANFLRILELIARVG